MPDSLAGSKKFDKTDETRTIDAMDSPAASPSRIPVVFSSSEEYAPYLAVALHSLAVHADPARSYDVAVLHAGLGETMQARLQGVVAAHGNIRLRFAEADAKTLAVIDRFDRSSCNWPSLVFYRLFLSSLFPEYDKIVFLGVDILVMADIAELFETALGDAPLAAVQDGGALGGQSIGQALNARGYQAPKLYFNSDVQVQNLRAWREQGWGEKAFEMLLRHRFPLIEQDALNILLEGRWIPLGMEWNFQLPQLRHFCPENYASIPADIRRESEEMEARKSWKIIHYPGGKPWTFHECAPSPLTDLWWRTALATPGFERDFKEALRRGLASLDRAARKHRLRAWFSSPRIRRRRREKIAGMREAVAFYESLLGELPRP